MGQSKPESHAFLVRPEVAEIARVHERTVDRWIEAGILQSVRIGGRVLIPRRSLEKLLSPCGAE